MKKAVVALFIALIFFFGSFYWFYERAGAKLAVNNKAWESQDDDFIVHIRVESIDKGFQVFRSIQYVGQEQIEIVHQTPLVSLSFKHKNHDYTGNTVSRVLKSGSSYHPQNPKIFEAPRKGEYTLFSESRFSVNGKEIKISHEEKLKFN